MLGAEYDGFSIAIEIAMFVVALILNERAIAHELGGDRIKANECLVGTAILMVLSNPTVPVVIALFGASIAAVRALRLQCGLSLRCSWHMMGPR